MSRINADPVGNQNDFNRQVKFFIENEALGKRDAPTPLPAGPVTLPLSAHDSGVLYLSASATPVTLTLANNAIPGTKLEILQTGAGAVTIAAQAGATILDETAGDFKIAGINKRISAHCISNAGYVASDGETPSLLGTHAVWYLSGDLAA